MAQEPDTQKELESRNTRENTGGDFKKLIEALFGAVGDRVTEEKSDE